MAMTINNNPMNPIPIWPSKTYWQCNQPTFHNAMAWPVLPKGLLPTIAVTISGTLPTAIANTAIAVVSEMPTSLSVYNRSYSGSASDPSGASTISLEGDVQAGETPPNPMPQILFAPVAQGRYHVTLKRGTTELTVYNNADESDIITLDLLKSGNGSYYVASSGDSRRQLFKIVVNDLDYHANSIANLVVKNLDNADVITPTTQTVQIESCYPYYSSDRCGHTWIGGQNVQTSAVDGVYYMMVTFGDNHYYSEPFLWLSNISRYTLVTYRRSKPILTTENYIVFNERNGTARSLLMYLPNIPQRPPFQFDVEVTEIDGRKYAEKQVSYRKDHIAFNCYEAFAEAVRLLWHCDIRYVGGKRIDYMEPPEIDWNTDNHLCDITLEMESDTVVQTNGTASAYIDSSDSSHLSYDNSFDNSFD